MRMRPLELEVQFDILYHPRSPKCRTIEDNVGGFVAFLMELRV